MTLDAFSHGPAEMFTIENLDFPTLQKHSNADLSKPTVRKLVWKLNGLSMVVIMAPLPHTPPKGRGTYCFWCGSHQHRFLSALSILDSSLLLSIEYCTFFSYPWCSKSLDLVRKWSVCVLYQCHNLEILLFQVHCTHRQTNKLPDWQIGLGAKLEVNYSIWIWAEG